LIIDLSHPIEDGLVTYVDLPAARVSKHMSHADSRGRYPAGTEFDIGRIDMVANTGTYLDAPFHRFAGAVDVAALPLQKTVDLDAIVVPVSTRAITAGCARGKAVLFHTGWDRHWKTPRYFEENPFVTGETAEKLVAEGIALVGIDSSNIDDIADRSRPAHTVFLRAGIPIVEHLCNLGALPPSGFRFFAAPLPIRTFGTSPVRAFAVVTR
jgi:kynurenine formamidase